MEASDKQRFMVAMGALGTAFKTSVSEDQLRLFWNLFNDYRIEEFEKACFDFMRKGKFFPVPSDLIHLMPSAGRLEHVTANEAWAIVVDSMDESATVVMTKEIAEARGIAYEVYTHGDKIGARMAFLEAYNRIITHASSPEWFISRGHDKTRVEGAISRALQLGRITQDQARLYLVEHKPETTLKQLQGKSAERVPRAEREPIDDVVKRIEAEDFQAGIRQREEKRLAHEAKRQQVLDTINEIRKAKGEL